MGKYHLADVYISELEKCQCDTLTGEKLTKLLEPFMLVLQQSNKYELCERIKEKVFQVIEDKSPQAVNLFMESTGQEVESLKLNFDYKLLSDKLLEYAKQDGIRAKNRKIIYLYVKKYQSLSEDTLALDEFPDVAEEDGLEGTEEAEERLQEEMLKIYEDERTEKRQRKRDAKKKSKMLKKLAANNECYVEDITVPESATGPATLPKPEEPEIKMNLGDLSKMPKLKNKRKDKSLVKKNDKKKQQGKKEGKSGNPQNKESVEAETEAPVAADDATEMETKEVSPVEKPQ